MTDKILKPIVISTGTYPCLENNVLLTVDGVGIDGVTDVVLTASADSNKILEATFTAYVQLGEHKP